jgi:hypothetical protein
LLQVGRQLRPIAPVPRRMGKLAEGPIRFVLPPSSQGSKESLYKPLGIDAAHHYGAALAYALVIHSALFQRRPTPFP